MSVRYKIYPSVLNAFQSLLDSDIIFESESNLDADGEYKKSIEEIEEKLTQNLIDLINKKPSEPIEAADKGTAFNEVIDRIILNTAHGDPAIKIKSHKQYLTSSNEVLDAPNIEAEYNGFKFFYDTELCKHVAADMAGSIPQYRCSAKLSTAYGDVELYGFADYIQKDRVIDLKTTSRYAFFKFENGWQKDLYPYCLVESGDMEDVSEFEYYVVAWRNRMNAPIGGTIYKEAYTYRHEAARGRLIRMCEHFIEWLEEHKDKITNKKIFGLE